MAGFQCNSPIDGHLVYEAGYDTQADIEVLVARASESQTGWASTPLADRVIRLQKASDYLYDLRDEIGAEITNQMGRPIKYSAFELGGVKERSDTMLALAEDALQDIKPAAIEGFDRWIAREALGVVAVLAPWNYPFLTSINAIIPALAAGNAVILKHSAQTPLVALRYKQAFEAAGLDEGLFQITFLDHDGAAALVGHASVNYVAFTGSVGGGHAVTRALGNKFIASGMELGGKDPAYVRADADPIDSAINLADGAFFNSGQSCCGIERIYVAEAIFEPFVAEVVKQASLLKLGDPREAETTLGPLVSAKGADFVRQQIKDAIAAGAKAHLPVDENWGSAYLPAQVLTGVTHDMDVMRKESFGPVVGIMAVADDEEAIRLMNDSDYGLTASLWTKDIDSARAIAPRIETGTVFLNRCDYLDPSLAWTGVKNSGRGCTLSALGYEQLTRPKSYHFKLPTEA